MDYKSFMDDLSKKGYTEKSTKEVPEGRTWYIPHHGVYNPNSSLNKNLMSGPDLTNKIVGVLTRFLGEPVVIMGDIEPMFHQVMVPREDRSLLRLL